MSTIVCAGCGRVIRDDRHGPDDEDLMRLLQAIVAAEAGRIGAGSAALELFLEMFPEFGIADRDAARFLAQRRPADYYQPIGGA